MGERWGWRCRLRRLEKNRRLLSLCGVRNYPHTIQPKNNQTQLKVWTDANRIFLIQSNVELNVIVEQSLPLPTYLFVRNINRPCTMHISGLVKHMLSTHINSQQRSLRLLLFKILNLQSALTQKHRNIFSKLIFN